MLFDGSSPVSANEQFYLLEPEKKRLDPRVPTMKLLLTLLLPLLLTAFYARADVYRCQQGDKVIFSDVPCGDNAEAIELKQPASSGTRLSNDAIEAVSESLAKDRAQRELERDIESQRQRIEDLQDKYAQRLEDLQTQLNDLEERIDRAYYGGYPKISLNHKKNRRRLRQDIRELKQNHKIKLERARDKMKNLKEESKALK